MGIKLVEASNYELDDLIEALEDELADLHAQRASVPPPEPFVDGSVIKFKKYNRSYDFAAIKAGGVWFVTHSSVSTQKNQHAPRTWGELLIWIGERNYETIELLS